MNLNEIEMTLLKRLFHRSFQKISAKIIYIMNKRKKQFTIKTNNNEPVPDYGNVK